MGESAISEEKTVVLVGRIGNGKSATGNSIIGANVFDSMPSSAGVTATCQLHKTVLDNDQILNVIDTPGLFDTSVEPEIIRNEIAKCIQMGKNGIHAVLVVLSLRTRFSQEEAYVIEILKQFFGGKIGDYMIVVFGHCDALEEMSLDDYLGPNRPEPLMKILEMCGNRYVLFDNKTKDELKKSEQQKELLRLVDTVVLNNGGIPYSNELFVDSPGVCEYGVKFDRAYEELLLEKIESKLRESTMRVEKQLEEEQAARKQAEAMALEAQKKAIAEISRLSEQLEISQRDSEVLRKAQIELDNKFKESMLRETTWRLEKQLENEQVARMQAEAALTKSKEEISTAREELKRAQIKAEKERKTHGATKKLLEEKNQLEHQIEEKTREMTWKLENQVAEKFARMQAEGKARNEEMKSNDEIQKLREDVDRVQRSILRMGGEHQIDSKHGERIVELERQLEEEQVGRRQAEVKTLEVEKKANNEISKVREDTERAQRDEEKLRKRIQDLEMMLVRKNKRILELKRCGQKMNKIKLIRRTTR